MGRKLRINMKTWKEYLENVGTTNPQNLSNQLNRPNASIQDRSLEAFPALITNLAMSAKGVLNPMAKQEINTEINKFRMGIEKVLQKYQSQGIGFSPNYQQNPW